MKIKFITLCVLLGNIMLVNSLYSASKDLIRVKQLRDSIYEKSLDKELLGKKFMDLVSFYFEQKDPEVLSQLEGVMIGLTYFPDMYFYTVLETSVQQYIKLYAGAMNRKINIEKKVRLFFILSHKGNTIDDTYFSAAKNTLTDKNTAFTHLHRVIKVYCGVVQQSDAIKKGVTKLVREKNATLIVDTYINLIYSCQASTAELETIRKYCLIFPINHN